MSQHRHHPCAAGANVVCCNHDCDQGRACPARAAPHDRPATAAERRMVLLVCVALCAAAWAAVILLPPWATWWAAAVALAGEYGFAIVGGVLGLAAISMAAYAIVTDAMDRHIPRDAGDTHAGFPPPTRTACAKTIERQADRALARAEREARQRARLAQQLQQQALPPSYPRQRPPAQG